MTVKQISLLEQSCIFNDSNSAVRNSTNALKGLNFPVPAFTSVAVPLSAAVGGFLGLPVAATLIKSGFGKAKESLDCGNVEGVAHNALWGVTGLAFGGVSSLLASEGVMGLTNTAVPVAMASAFAGLGLGMNAVMGVYGAYGLNEARKFGNELEERSSRDALEWLHEQVTPNAKNPELAAQLVPKKWNSLELRVGADCAKMIRETLPKMKDELDDLADAKLNGSSLPETEKALTTRIATFIQDVRKANFKQQVKFALFILLALVGTAAVIAMIISTGPASPIIFALGAMLWLTVDSSKLHSYIGEKLWTWHCDVKTTEPTCQKTDLISHKTIS